MFTERERAIFFGRFFGFFNSERCSVGLLFPTYRAQKLMKEAGEEWETKGFTATVVWGLVEEGGYVLVGRISSKTIMTVLEESESEINFKITY